MKKSFEEKIKTEYNNEISKSAPDFDRLWDRIEEELPEKNLAPIKRKIHMSKGGFSAVIAAVFAIVILPIAINQFQNNNQLSSSLADNSPPIAGGDYNDVAQENYSESEDSVTFSPPKIEDNISYTQLKFSRVEANANIPEITYENSRYFVEEEVLAQTDKFLYVKVLSANYNQGGNFIQYSFNNQLTNEIIIVKTPLGEDFDELSSTDYSLKIGREYILPIKEDEGGISIVFPSAPQIELTLDGLAVVHNGWKTILENENCYLESPPLSDSDYFYDRLAVCYKDDILRTTDLQKG